MNKITLIFNDHFRKEVAVNWKPGDLEKTISFLEMMKTGNILFNFKDGKLMGVDIKASLPLTS